MVLFKKEMKQNSKILLIWSLVIGFLCCVCLLLYSGIEESMEDITGAFANMGSFSQALGMDRISIGTIEGYYAIEITIILSLGGAMFAAMSGAGIVAKEEEGHTSEFLNTLPIGRSSILFQKYLALLVNIILFHVVCIVCIATGFWTMKESPDIEYFAVYHAMAFLMTMEVGTICFLISTVSKTKMTGTAIGMAVFLYIMDLMGRILPGMKYIKYATPFYYCNGAGIFSGEGVSGPAVGIGIFVMAACIAAAYIIYQTRDIQS